MGNIITSYQIYKYEINNNTIINSIIMDENENKKQKKIEETGRNRKKQKETK